MFSGELLNRCSEIYDYNNDVRDLFSGLTLEEGQTLLDSLSREKVIEYHMGNLTTRNASFSWGDRVSDSKIKMMKHFLAQGEPSQLEDAIVERNLILDILESRSKEDRIYIYIKQEYDFWDSLDDDSLRDY